MGVRESEVGKIAAGLGQNKRRDEMGGASRTREQTGFMWVLSTRAPQDPQVEMSGRALHA